MSFRLALTFVILIFGLNQAASAASSDTPLAYAEIMRYGMPYPGDRYLTLRAIYEPYIRDAGFETSRVQRDLAYGPHEQQVLDVLEPQDPPDRAMPVVIFVHGGGFVSGDKGGRDGSEIFDNVLNYFTRHGLLGINMNYRLAPEHVYPAAQDDIRRTLRWVREHASDLGGDPDRIFLVGHSAGATHVAAYIFNESLQLDEGSDGVAGAILMSGVYDTDGRDDEGHVYFGPDPSDVPGRLPLANVAGRKVPVFVVSAELDPLRMQLDALRLTEALCARDGRCPRHQQVAGHNHYSLMYHINTLDDSIAGNMLDFIRQTIREAAESREQGPD